MNFPGREARAFLAQALGVSEAFVLAHPETPVEPNICQAFRAFLHRREQGEPYHLIVGSCPFYGREFLVLRGVLIPRPETELLVAAALKLPLPKAPRVLDMGTGSGCLAVTLALEIPQATVVASDISWQAAAATKLNAARFGTLVRICLGDLASHLRGPFHLLVANLPYLPESFRDKAPIELAFEPQEALYAGPDGLAVLTRLLHSLPRLLAPGAFALLEVGPGQGQTLVARLPKDLALVQMLEDGAGVQRVVVLKRAKAPPRPCSSFPSKALGRGVSRGGNTDSLKGSENTLW